MVNEQGEPAREGLAQTSSFSGEARRFSFAIALG
jgi:hypothetical protein